MSQNRSEFDSSSISIGDYGSDISILDLNSNSTSDNIGEVNLNGINLNSEDGNKINLNYNNINETDSDDSNYSNNTNKDEINLNGMNLNGINLNGINLDEINLNNKDSNYSNNTSKDEIDYSKSFSDSSEFDMSELDVFYITDAFFSDGIKIQYSEIDNLDITPSSVRKYKYVHFPELIRDNIININVWKIGYDIEQEDLITLWYYKTSEYESEYTDRYFENKIDLDELYEYLKVQKSSRNISLDLFKIEMKAKYIQKIREGYYIPGTEQEVCRPQLGVSYIPPKYDEYGNIVKEGNIPDSYFPIAISPKLDGNRVIYNPKYNKLYSRENVEVLGFTEIEEHCRIFLSFLDSNYNIDGELYNHDLCLEEISSIVNTSININEVDKFKLYYYIFDIMSDSLNYDERIKIVRDAYKKYKLYFKDKSERKIRIVRYKRCSKRDDIEHYLSYYLNKDYEGIVIRHLSPNSIRIVKGLVIDYRKYFNTKNKALIKYKPEYDENCLILSISEGEGRNRGIPIFKMKRIIENRDHIIFRCTMRGNNQYRSSVYINREKYIGLLANVIYSSETSKLSLRNPRIKEIYI